MLALNMREYLVAAAGYQAAASGNPRRKAGGLDYQNIAHSLLLCALTCAGIYRKIYTNVMIA